MATERDLASEVDYLSGALFAHEALLQAWGRALVAAGIVA